MAEGGLLQSLYVALGLEADEASFEKGEKLIEGVHKALEALAVYEGVKTLHEFVDQTVEAAVGFEHLSQRLGISTDAVQRLGYAADVSGASTEDMQTAVQHLSLQMEEARKTGTGPLIDGLDRLGISYSEVKGKSPDQVINRLADAFADAGPEVNKTGLAMEVLGRGGAALIPLLNKGSDGIRELGDEFAATGAEIDENGIESLKKFEEEQKRLHYTLVGFRNQAVIALLPQLQKIADALQKWITANRELIKARLEQIVAALTVAFKALVRVVGIAFDVFSVLGQILDRTVEAFEALVGGAGGVEDVLVGAAIAVGAAWALANAPLILMAALIAAAILIGQDLWSWANGGDSVLKNLYQGFVQYLGESGAGRVVLALIHSVKALIEYVKESVEWLGRAAAALTSDASGSLNKVLEQKRGEQESIEAGDRWRAQQFAGRFAPGGVFSGQPAAAVAGPVSNASAVHNTFAPSITVQGNTNDPHGVADAVHGKMLEFWNDQMNHAAASTGATKGALP